MQKRDIKMFWPSIPSKDILLKNIEELLWPSDQSRPFITEGQIVEEFESECIKKWGFDYVLFTNSGTSALELALFGSGVKAGDDVISTPLTCTATNLPILLKQANIIFSDVQYDTANIDPKDIEHRITEKTKAITLVHWGGYPCEMDEINNISKEHNLKVIADGAHALGATYKGRPISDFADFTMFSLQAIKQMTTIDGGLLAIRLKNSRKDLIEISKDPKNKKIFREIYGKEVHEYFKDNPKEENIPEDYFGEKIFKEIEDRANEFEKESHESLTKNYDEFKEFWLDWQKAESIRRRRWFGIGRAERIPNPEKGFSSYPTYECGGKFHGNNFNAMMGLAALKEIDIWQERRRRIVERYNSELKDVSGVTLFKNENDRQSGNWLYNINVEKRGDFVINMKSNGIETSIVHERNDNLPLFKKFSEGDYPVLTKLGETRICIPLHQNLTDEDVDYIINSIKGGINI
jgi:dTDP-4-amino-4,6-dideoxygalactose transaminase